MGDGRALRAPAPAGPGGWAWDDAEAAAALINALRTGPLGAESGPALSRLLHLLFATDHHLVVYGSLAPGESNHAQLAGLEGEWSRGWVHGRLLPDPPVEGYPFLRWSPGGEPVPAWLLTSPGLAERWARLDAFEGPAYRRFVVPFHDSTGVRALGYVYGAPD